VVPFLQLLQASCRDVAVPVFPPYAHVSLHSCILSKSQDSGYICAWALEVSLE
jgi:hypothetical protein